MSTPVTLPTVRRWVAGPLSKDVQNALLRVQALPDVRYVAVMPDVHLAREVCVGTVLATGRLVYPAAVGGDIGCGIAAVALDCTADVLRGKAFAERTFAALGAAVPTNRHRHPHGLPDELERFQLSSARLESIRRRDGRVQFGTLGRGNHFLELQSDDAGKLWLMVHSGSRGIGQAIRDHHVARAGCASRNPLIALDGESAAAYLADADWARSYADASRRAMLDAAAEVLKSLCSADVIHGTLVTCDHNHVRRETHFGEDLWVHRKGASSARAGEPGIIPGSMGTVSHLVEGRGDPDSLCSSSHGAGRAMSRDEARRRISSRELARQLRNTHVDERCSDRLREEAPAAYKDIGAVMRAQRDLVRITRTLRPVLTYKGR